MRKIIALVAVLLLVLVACGQKPVETKPEKPVTQVEPTQEVDLTLPPEFKIAKQFAVRYPASINATIANVGMGRGDVKVTAQAMYAELVAFEGKTTIKDLRPGEEKVVGFEIPSTTQWVSYSVKIEQVGGVFPVNNTK